MAGPKLQEGVQNPWAWLQRPGPHLEPVACLVNYDLLRSQDVALIFWAVNWCLRACSRTPRPRGPLAERPPDTGPGRKGRAGGGAGLGSDCRPDTGAHTPPSKASLPPEQRKASF